MSYVLLFHYKVRDKLKSYQSETNIMKNPGNSSGNIWESSLITENNLNCWQLKPLLTDLWGPTEILQS